MMSVSVSPWIKNAKATASDVKAAAVQGSWRISTKAAGENADVLLAVARGVVVGVFTIRDIVPSDEPNRFRFVLADPPDWARQLKGSSPPEELAFKQGSRNPIRMADTPAVRATVVDRDEELLIRGHRLTIAPNGDLSIAPAPGARVTVVPGRPR